LADDCDQRITGSLKEMMQEVDRLLLKIDRLEEEEPDINDWELYKE